MIRTHKIRLIPTVKQEIAFRKACGVARYSYNYNLAKWNEEYKKGNKPNMYSLKKLWNSEKPEWVYDSPKDANIQPVIDLGKAFNNFFKGRTKHPTFHKKGINDGFYISNDKAKFKNNKIQLPKIGLVKIREQLRFNGKIMSFTIKKEANQWYVCVLIELPDKQKKDTNKIGIDLGVKTLATLDNGKKYNRSKSTERNSKRLKVAQRNLSKKKKGSNNRNKAKMKVARVHLDIRNQRKDLLHKVTSDIIKNHGNIICLEDLSVNSMLEKKVYKSLKRGIVDASFNKFRVLMEYKANKVLYVDRYFPSSKLCCRCKTKKLDLKLSDRLYDCKNCGLLIDRDLNASINIKLNAVG